MTVTFVGHRDTPENVYGLLYEALWTLIQKEGANCFYVGEQGAFDRMAARALCELKKIYSHIEYYVVLAYMPTLNSARERTAPTLLPAEVAQAPAKYSLDRRNRWMIDKSDVVIAYVNRSCGGAASFRKRAITKGKRVINLAQKAFE